jgi:hypothetical protein
MLSAFGGEEVEFVEEFYLLEKQHDGMKAWQDIASTSLYFP